MPIPVDTSLVANAIPFVGPFIATPMNVCKTPPDGFKAVNFQVRFNLGADNPYFIDMGIGNPPPLSQLSAIYIDATNCSVDVIILFPDSGYQVQVSAGNSGLYPVFTNSGTPRFYVIAKQTVQGLCVINVFAMNQFVPEFANLNNNKSVIYGLWGFDLSATLSTFPFFSANDILIQNAGSKVYTQLPATVIANFGSRSFAYIDAISVNAVVAASARTAYVLSLSMQGDNIFNLPFVADSTSQHVNLLNITGFKLLRAISSGSPVMTMSIDSTTNLTTGIFYYTFAGALFNEYPALSG